MVFAHEYTHVVHLEKLARLDRRPAQCVRPAAAALSQPVPAGVADRGHRHLRRERCSPARAACRRRLPHASSTSAAAERRFAPTRSRQRRARRLARRRGAILVRRVFSPIPGRSVRPRIARAPCRRHIGPRAVPWLARVPQGVRAVARGIVGRLRSRYPPPRARRQVRVACGSHATGFLSGRRRSAGPAVSSTRSSTRTGFRR